MAVSTASSSHSSAIQRSITAPAVTARAVALVRVPVMVTPCPWLFSHPLQRPKGLAQFLERGAG